MFSEERLRREICEVMERLYFKGLVSSVGGNVSVISREGNFILITPTGLDKMNIKPNDIVKVRLNGEVVGKGFPSSEVINHLGIYKERNDIFAIVHAHPPTAVGIVSSGYVPKSVTPEYIVMIRNLGVVDFVTPSGGSVKVLTDALKNTDIVLIKNHGVFSVGYSLMQAFSRIEVLEEASKMVFVGKAFGGLKELTSKQINDVIDKYVKKI